MKPYTLRSCLGAVALLAGVSLHAATVNLTYLEGQIPIAPGAMATLGTDLFGDKVNLYNGALTFEQTDLSVPGNNALPVALGRTYSPGRQLLTRGQFGDWDLNVPRMTGSFSTPGWVVTSQGGTNRCTGFYFPPLVTSVGSPSVAFNATDYWQGYYISVPGHGSQEVLKRATSPSPGYTRQPADGGSYPLVTHANWQIGCVAALANGAGEGFIAVAPDGVRYRFDWMASRSNGEVKKLGKAISRKDIFLYATEVVDRFGNWVHYTYDPANPMNLQRIESSDGRVITLSYTNGRVASASDGTKTLYYYYEDSNKDLTRIALPDGSQWRFSLLTMTPDGNPQNPIELIGEGASCDFPGTQPSIPLVGTITHPSGAIGTFTTQFMLHGRHNVDKYCLYATGNGSHGEKPYGAVYPKNFMSQTLLEKSIEGPGLSKLTWSYAYLSGSSWAPCTSNCSETKTVTVSEPMSDADHTRNKRYTFGNHWRVNEGQLLKVEEGWNPDAGTALKTTTYRYRQPAGQIYPEQFGTSLSDKFDWLASRNRPQDQRVITQQGTTFTWEADASAAGFDGLARPLVVTKSSSLGFAKRETTSYVDRDGKWVIGQVGSVTVDSAGDGKTYVPESTSFDQIYGLPMLQYGFGRLLQSVSYYGDGTVYQALDPAGRPTTFSDYYRGIPRSITRRDGTTESASVDNLGHVTAYTNAAGTKRSYGYDTMGRLATISYPRESWGDYATTNVGYAQVASPEYGLPAGHWRQIVTTGNGVSIRYYDALWRPGLTRTYDAGNESGTSSFVEAHYDPDGHKVYESYPVSSTSSIGSGLPGRKWFYDALGRTTALTQDSELGALNTVTQYIDSFRRLTTNPRGYATTSAFQAFDFPSEDAPIAIWSPESVTVGFARNAFGKPLNITRSGPGWGSGPASVTRYYVYDQYQRLCKTVEPETWATVQSYDAAGNVAWRASGMALNGDICSQGDVPDGRKITHSYDAMDRVTYTGYGDGSPSIGRSYTPDGLLNEIATYGGSNSIRWSYSYNNRRLLTNERYTWGDPNTWWDFGWSINANGHISALTDPWGTMAYAPNALGQPTQVSGYASDIAYHASGAITSYSLSNGTAFSAEFNTRGLPKLWAHSGVVKDTYLYDPNGNVGSITDSQEGGATSRSMGYDGLDRLTTANGIWGQGGYVYDALDNLRIANIPGRVAYISYNQSNQPSDININGAYTVYGYDTNGNVTQRGGQNFSFDIGNRMTSAPGAVSSYLYDGHGRRNLVFFASGDYMHQAYTQDGKLRFAYRLSQGFRRHVYLGDRLIAEKDNNGTTTYSHTDPLGSPVASTNQSAQVISRTRFDPYGVVAAGTNPARIGFTGHVNDPEAGLVYMQQRYYDPVAGRLLSVDPVTTNVVAGERFNRYDYANDNPYRFVDPDGRDNLEIRLVGHYSGYVSFSQGATFGSGASLGGPQSTAAGQLGSAPGPQVAASDQRTLARGIFAEAAGSYREEGVMEAVGWVIVNRVGDKAFGDTLSGVLTARQFASVGGNLWNLAADPSILTGSNAAAYGRSSAVASGILNGSIADPTGGAQYFYSSTTGLPPKGFFTSATRSGRLELTLAIPPFSFLRDTEGK